MYNYYHDALLLNLQSQGYLFQQKASLSVSSEALSSWIEILVTLVRVVTLAKDGSPDADAGRTFFDGNFKVVGHPHTQLG